MTARAVLPPTLGEHFATTEAASAGVARSRLAAGDLERPFHGVRSRHVDATLEWETEVRRRMAAYVTRMPSGTFFVRSSALVASALPVPTALRGDPHVEVGTLHPIRAVKGRGVVGSQIRGHLASFVETDGFAATDPCTTWASLAQRVHHRDLVALGDAIVRVERMPGSGRILRNARATIEDLGAVLARGRWPGRPRLRSALVDVRVGSASPPESHLRLAVTQAGLPEPELDVDVRDRSGLLLGCSELAYPDRRVALEYEGDHHRIDRRQWNRDIEKYAAYTDAGWSVVRITARHLYPFAAPAVRLVGDALIRAGWRP